MMRSTISALTLLVLTSVGSVHASTHFDRGLDAYGDGLYAEAARHWEKGAATGDTRSQFNLAVLTEHGKGLEQDIAVAVSWYRQAAKNRFPDAQFSLANILMSGAGPIKANVDEAVMWYLEAAESGHIRSQFTLGTMLVNGEQVPKDLVAAERWLELASHNGHMEAESLLARLRRELDQGLKLASWVKERNPSAWTVELFKSPDAERARKFVRIVGLESAAVFESNDGMHRVVAGVFEDQASANSAIAALPEPLKLRIPVVRQFQQLQMSMVNVQ